MAKIALHGHFHTCPQKGHHGGPIMVKDSGRPTINGVPIAIVGDKCHCDSGVDAIVTGNSLFTYNGIPVAVTGSKTEHGGIVIEGHDDLTID